MDYGSILDSGPYSTTTAQADPIIQEFAIHWVLAKEAYASNRRPSIEGWMYFQPLSGADAAVYRLGEQIIVAFPGSQTPADIHNDVVLSDPKTKNEFPKAAAAVDMLETLMDYFPDCIVVLTGHSLGGAVARVAGGELGLDFVTFNAAAPPSAPVINVGNSVCFHIVFDIISAWYYFRRK